MWCVVNCVKEGHPTAKGALPLSAFNTFNREHRRLKASKVELGDQFTQNQKEAEDPDVFAFGDEGVLSPFPSLANGLYRTHSQSAE